jgi:hypothetical protein
MSGLSPTMLPDLLCADLDERRDAISLRDDLEGIDFLEVRTAPPADNQLVLELHFIRKRPPGTDATLHAYIDALVAHPEAIRIGGGESRKHIRVVSAARSGEVLEVRVDRPGDFSEYTLTLGNPGVTGIASLDPVFSGIRFSFKAGCPTRFDCAGDCRCDAPDRPDPVIDYLAKDYRSFRQALLDRLPTLSPGWVERHEADVGMALIELLAYTADQLSYQQDAVANEAYLDSARQRVSVRRHARLVDYPIFEGASARAFVTARVQSECTIDAGSQLLTTLQSPFAGKLPPLAPVLQPSREDEADRARDTTTVFETRAAAHLHPSLQDIRIHLWDLGGCCLPTGATTIDLDGDLAYDATTPGKDADWRLRAGRIVLFEESVGVATGLAADADPTHRQAVRLTAAESASDPVVPGPVTRLTWAAEDALAFPLCVSRADENGVMQRVGVAQANVMVADHGRAREQYWPEDPAWPPATPPLTPPRGLTRGPRPVRFLLDEGPLSSWRPFKDKRDGGDDDADVDVPVAQMNAARPRPEVRLTVERSPVDTIDYKVADDLIGAPPSSPQFVAELMNDGRATLRFGDGVNGLPPADGAFVRTRYHVGRGRAGNVGAQTIRHLLLPVVPPGPPPPIVDLRNPMPAQAGEDPETIAQVKERAPVAFRSPQMRAVTAADYAEVATRHPKVSGAVARFRWTGSWLTIYLTIDPKDRQELETGLAEEVKEFVAGYTQTGYDLEVRPPLYVPLDLELFVCVAPDRFRADVERAVRDELSSRRLPHGRLGFFHPDRLGFGEPLYLSVLYAAVSAVPGVVSVSARRFSRYFDDDPPPARPLTAANVDAGLIAVGELEVLELAGDPSLPERGVLTVTTGGGR